MVYAPCRRVVLVLDDPALRHYQYIRYRRVLHRRVRGERDDAPWAPVDAVCCMAIDAVCVRCTRAGGAREEFGVWREEAVAEH